MMPSTFVRPPTLRRIASWCAVLTAAMGLVTSFGWISGMPLLASIRAQYIPMAPSTAICFALVGVGLASLLHWPGGRWGSILPALLVLAVALVKLLEFSLEWRLGLDSWLVRDPATFGTVLTGRMSPITAMNFFFTGVGLLAVGSKWLRRLAGACGTINAIVALTVMVGYWYGTPLLYGGSVIPVALPTACAFLLCGTGMIAAAGLEGWPLREFVGQSTRAMLLRHFIPAIAIAMLLMGWLRTILIAHWPANPAALSAASALLSIALMTWIISRVAAKLGSHIDRAEQARNAAQAELLLLNEKLEERVLARTLELRQKNEVMEDELQMARELQFSLLPRQFPNVPPGTQSHEGALQFLSLFFPTGNVSGDFFTVIQVCEDSVGVFICDVMGHGVRSALLTTMIRALVEEHAPHIKEADKLLARVNQGLTGILQHSGTMMFATGFYLILDIGSSQINYASAGHPAPFLITHDGGAIELLNGEGSSGPAMGLFAGASYRATQRAVHQGDFIILFTDGLFEVEGASGELFSKEALLDCVKRRISLPPQEILNRMVKEVREFSHEKRFDDDVCVVGVQLRHRG